MRLQVAPEIIANKIVITVLNDRVHERGEGALVTECARVDGVKDALQIRIDVEFLVEVGVAEVLDVFGEIAEEEDVLVTDFAGNFDLEMLVSMQIC